MSEKCPDICPVCTADIRNRFYDINSPEFDPILNADSTYIYLEDCDHYIELKTMNKLLDAQMKGGVLALCCPKCRILIGKSERYRDTINKFHANYEKIKELCRDYATTGEKVKNRIIHEILEWKEGLILNI